MRAPEKLPTVTACSNTPVSSALCFTLHSYSSSTILQSMFTDFSLCLRHFSVSHLTGAAAMRPLPFQEGCQCTPSWDCNRLLSPGTECGGRFSFKMKLGTLAHVPWDRSSLAFPGKSNSGTHTSSLTAGLVARHTANVCPLWQQAEFEFWSIKSLIFT